MRERGVKMIADNFSTAALHRKIAEEIGLLLRKSARQYHPNVNIY
jgi:hypothetical protein